jgi:hypothetical protein
MKLLCRQCSTKFESEERKKFCSDACEQAYNVTCWSSYVASLPWQKGQLDECSWFTFLRASSLQISSQDAYREVEQRIRDAGDHPKSDKLQRQIRRAYQFAGSVHTAEYAPKPPKPTYQPEILQRVAKRTHEVTPRQLQRISPISTCLSPAGFLHQLYRPEEKVVVFNVFESQGCDLWHYGRALNYLRAGQPGVWYMANPVDVIDSRCSGLKIVCRR